MSHERWRVDDLAEMTGTSVDTIRFYQKRRLLPAPAREGRVAWYDATHRDRLLRIRGLQEQGLSLALIRRLLGGNADARLAAAVADRTAAWSIELTRTELAERTGLSEAVIDALTESGLLTPHTVGGQARFTTADAELVSTGRALLDVGLPLEELLGLARHYHEVTTEIADRAVEMFDRHVRRPIHQGMGTDADKAERLVAAFDVLFPAVTALVSTHFSRVLLERADAALAETETAPLPRERSA
jgi:DNA-binding transcriptional MerR regulator